MPPPRSGAVLGPKLIHLLKEWGIEKKIFLITLDNARYNDGVGGRLIEHFKLANSLLCDGNFVHIRCANHILNLIFKAASGDSDEEDVAIDMEKFIAKLSR
ncbi:hypothetical protein FXO38_06459 [Capsicum annuum]|nr:hypothetical protein FXO38_06459 [Capsicum annuum]KAF3674183.1 hypothetical protein FXO37_06524 [Capsicum annuum]